MLPCFFLKVSPKLQNVRSITLNIFSKSMGYREKRIIGYSMMQMYNVVSKVEEYHQFVPYCNKSLIISRSGKSFQANLFVGFPPLNVSYVSNVTLDKPNSVESVAYKTNVFNELITSWKFRPGIPEISQTSILEFNIRFEFNSLLYSRVAKLFFDHIVETMVEAFLKRAESKFGPSSIPHQPPKIILYKR